MAAIILSSLQNLKWLKIGYKYIKQSPEVVFGCFYMFTRFPIAKWYLTRDIMCQTRNIYAISRIFWLQKMVTWHRKSLWLFDKLGLNWDPFCENHLRQRLSWAKRLRFEPVAQPETGLSLRPFMKSPLAFMSSPGWVWGVWLRGTCYIFKRKPWDTRFLTLEKDFKHKHYTRLHQSCDSSFTWSCDLCFTMSCDSYLTPHRTKG